MTEEQAIERITQAIDNARQANVAWTCDDMAEAAWNEMKAIAQEDTTTLRFYTGKAVNGSGGKELIL